MHLLSQKESASQRETGIERSLSETSDLPACLTKTEGEDAGKCSMTSSTASLRSPLRGGGRKEFERNDSSEDDDTYNPKSAPKISEKSSCSGHFYWIPVNKAAPKKQEVQESSPVRHVGVMRSKSMLGESLLQSK
jgi:hypothetical protein